MCVPNPGAQLGLLNAQHGGCGYGCGMFCLRAGWPGWRAGRTLAGGVHEAPSAPERWAVALGSRRPLPEAAHGILTVRHTNVWDKDCFLVSVTS